MVGHRQVGLHLGQHQHQPRPTHQPNLRLLPLRQQKHGQPLLQRRSRPRRHPGTDQQPSVGLRNIHAGTDDAALVEGAQRENAGENGGNCAERGSSVGV